MTNPPRRPLARYSDEDTFVMPTIEDAPTEQIPAYRRPEPTQSHAPIQHYPEDAAKPLYRDEVRPARPARRSLPPVDPEPPKRSKKNKLLIAVAALVAVVLVAIAVVYFIARANINSINRDNLLPDNRPAPALDGPLNVLLLGLDARKFEEPGTEHRSDTMMLAHIPADRSKVYLISIPRDSWVALSTGEYGKINAAHALGGPQASVQTVEKLLGIEIHSAGIINFEGFVNMTEVLGGVTVDNPIASYEKLGDYNFPEGKITIQGKQALAFVRQRKELPNGDLDRTRRQRLVIRAVTEKLLSSGTFSNPVKLNEALSQLKTAITLDDTITADQIVGLGLSMHLKSGKDIESIMLPTAGFALTSYGEDVNILDEKRVKELSKAIKEDKLDAYVKAHKDDDPVTGNMPTTPPPEGKVNK